MQWEIRALQEEEAGEPTIIPITEEQINEILDNIDDDTDLSFLSEFIDNIDTGSGSQNTSEGSNTSTNDEVDPITSMLNNISDDIED